MNWFSLLKNQVQTQRQGFRLDDKDESYVLEDDDDCYEKLLAFVENRFHLEIKESYRTGFSKNRSQRGELNFNKPSEYLWLYYKFEATDEIYCLALEALKFFISYTTEIDWTNPQLPPEPTLSQYPNRLKIYQKITKSGSSDFYYSIYYDGETKRYPIMYYTVFEPMIMEDD